MNRFAIPRTLSALLLTTLLCLGSALPAAAHVSPGAVEAPSATVTVCASGCDYITIQGAIDAEPAGTTISVTDPVHTESNINVTDDFTIIGQGPAHTIVQATADPETLAGSVFRVSAAVTVTIEGMTIRHGTAAASAYAAAFAYSESPPDQVSSSASAAALAQALGGGVYNRGTLTLRDCEVRDNLAWAEAVAEAEAQAHAVVTATASSAAGAVGFAAGGGIANEGILTVERCSVISNTVVATATASAHVSATTQTTGPVTETAEADASAEAPGAGIYNGGTLTVVNSTISGNVSASTSGAVDDRNVSPTTPAVQVADDQRPGRHVVIRRGTGNEEDPVQAFASAGDPVQRSSGPMSTQAPANGGSGGTTSATADSTGGIYNDDQATINYATVTDNEANSSASAASSVLGSAVTSATNAGGINNDGGTLDLFASIVADQASGPDCSGDPVTSSGYNLDSDGTCITDGVNNDVEDDEPGLGNLAQNPPGESRTHALLVASPALDWIPPGSCTVATDQRGVTRPQHGNCDIGAFEAESGRIVVDKVTDPSGDPQRFDFTITTSGSSLGFDLGDTDDPHAVTTWITDTQVSEEILPIWECTDLNCASKLGTSTIDTSSPPTAHITLQSGDTVTCTFTNVLTVERTGEATDDTGAGLDLFFDSETVYATGSGFPTNTDVDVYIVDDRAWADQDAIPGDVSDGMETVTTDANGDLGPEQVWAPITTPGEYDMVFDVDRDGTYDQGLDVVDHPNHPGFTVLGSVVGGAVSPVDRLALLAPWLRLLALIALTTGGALGLASLRRRRA